MVLEDGFLWDVVGKKVICSPPKNRGVAYQNGYFLMGGLQQFKVHES